MEGPEPGEPDERGEPGEPGEHGEVRPASKDPDASSSSFWPSSEKGSVNMEVLTMGCRLGGRLRTKLPPSVRPADHERLLPEARCWSMV